MVREMLGPAGVGVVGLGAEGLAKVMRGDDSSLFCYCYFNGIDMRLELTAPDWTEHTTITASASACSHGKGDLRLSRATAFKNGNHGILRPRPKERCSVRTAAIVGLSCSFFAAIQRCLLHGFLGEGRRCGFFGPSMLCFV